MKKLVVLIVVLCVVMIHSSTSAEMQPIQLYDQNVFTLTQKLQGFGIKIWNMNYRLSKEGYPGYEANFGDNPANQMAFLVGNGGTVLVSAIITQFSVSDYPNYPTLEDSFSVAGAIMVIAGLTFEDIMKLDRGFSSNFLGAIAINPQMTKYHKTFSAYSVRTSRLILMEISMEVIRPNVGKIWIFIYARA